MEALGQSTRPPSIGQAASCRVPVFPEAAPRTLSLMRDPRANPAQVVQAASLDPGTAGLLMRLANSALFGSRAPVATLSAAIARLGFATARKVIVSAALRPVFGSAKLEEAWPHSVQVADLSEHLACQIGDRSRRAFLAGLLHDVGRIVMLSLHSTIRLDCRAWSLRAVRACMPRACSYRRIMPPWGRTSPPDGICRSHGFGDPLRSPAREIALFTRVSAVSGRVPSGSEEDLPSIIRLEASLKGLGLSLDGVSDCTISALGSWLAAA